MIDAENSTTNDRENGPRGPLDGQNEGPVNVLPSSTQLSCCGTYPNRFPFNPANSRGCCQQKTYNTELYTCCSDGSLKTDALACA